MILKWDDATYLTGVEEVDAQHKELFKRINDLLKACTTNKGTASELAQEKSLETLDFLAQYVIEHFKCEEEYMERYRSPLRDENKAEHEKFLKQYTELRTKIDDNGLSRQMIIRLEGFLCGWLTNHITKVDSSLSEVLPQEEPVSVSIPKAEKRGNFFSRLWKGLFGR
ncbi:MAG: hemerythrin family protein [Desulfobulbaceae bacterium]|nr:hemerythrin family protein [Desulfobulbaceae bacterium]